jgi:hypothetical protein
LTSESKQSWLTAFGLMVKNLAEFGLWLLAFGWLQCTAQINTLDPNWRMKESLGVLEALQKRLRPYSTLYHKLSIGHLNV